MKAARRQRRGDLIAAWVVLLSSLSMSVLAFASIKKLEHHELPLVSELSLGDSSLVITSGEQCIGTITTSFIRDKAFSFQAVGALHVTYASQAVTATFKLDARFNPLGQLVESLFEIESIGVEGSLRTKDVNPIELTVSAQLPPDHMSRSFRVSGPIHLLENPNGSYRLTYPMRSRSTAGLSGKLVEQFKQRLHLDLNVKLAPKEYSCEEHSGALDVSSFVALTSNQLERFDSWFSESSMDGGNVAP